MLSRIVVELNGGLGLTRAIPGGEFPRPEAINNMLSSNGVPPLTIWMSGVMGTCGITGKGEIIASRG